MEEILRESLQRIVDIIAEFHDDEGNCPYCGQEFIITDPHPVGGGGIYDCPSTIASCAGKQAKAVLALAKGLKERRDWFKQD